MLRKVPEKGEIIRIPDGPDNEDQTDQTDQIVRFDSECDSLRSLLRQAFFDGKQPADMARAEWYPEALLLGISYVPGACRSQLASCMTSWWRLHVEDIA